MFKYVFWFLLFFNGGFLTGEATAPLAPPPASYGHGHDIHCICCTSLWYTPNERYPKLFSGNQTVNLYNLKHSQNIVLFIPWTLIKELNLQNIFLTSFDFSIGANCWHRQCGQCSHSSWQQDHNRPQANACLSNHPGETQIQDHTPDVEQTAEENASHPAKLDCSIASILHLNICFLRGLYMYISPLGLGLLGRSGR